MIWFIAFGSAVGGVARYLIGSAIQRSSTSSFPVGTLIVNITGSLLLGFLARYFASSAPSPEVRAMLTIGLCGGYTTFSAFSYETLMLFEQGDVRRGALYVGLSLVLSVAAMAAGMGLARGLLALRHAA